VRVLGSRRLWHIRSSFSSLEGAFAYQPLARPLQRELSIHNTSVASNQHSTSINLLASSMKISFVIAALALMFVISPHAHAQTVNQLPPYASAPPVAYVSPTGSDTTGDGTQAKPFASIVKAGESMANPNGGTIYLMPATTHGRTSTGMTRSSTRTRSLPSCLRRESLRAKCASRAV
jgi:hypothetical protein